MVPNEAFMAMVEVAYKKHAESTRQSYRLEVRFFAEFLNETWLAAAESSDALNYLRHLQRSVSCHDNLPLAPKTIRRKILTLFSVFEDASDMDLVKSNPFSKVARVAREIRIELKRPPRIVQFDDIGPSVKLCENTRNRAIFAILFGGGLRVSELVALKTCDVFCLGKFIGLRVVTAKTGKTRPVTLPEWASKYLREYYSEYSPPERTWLFPSPFYGGKTAITRKWVSNLCFQTFGCRAHSARHTHISFLLSKGVPLADVARAVGHASITSTMAYDQRVLSFGSSVSVEADYRSRRFSIAVPQTKVYMQ